MQVRGVPRVDEGLDDEAVVGGLPEVGLAVAAVGGPVRAAGEAVDEDVLDAAAPAELVELLRVVDGAAELEPLADRPVVLDVRSLVDGEQLS